jgi:hypothetical protein
MKNTIEFCKKWKDNPSNGEVSTPIELVREMLDKIPVEVWENPESKFLDPCMGKGTFLLEIVNRLVYIYNYSKEDAISRVYGYDVLVKYSNFLKRRGGFKNVFYKDFLNEEIDMKFDVIVGNPPYQHSSNKRWKLWVTFLEKGITLLKNNAIISMITPISWVDGLGSELIRAKEIINTNNLLVFNNNVNSHFIGISEKIGYTVIQKESYKNETIFIDNQVEKKINFNLREKSIKQTITEKVFCFENKIETKNYLSNKNPHLELGKCSVSVGEEYPIKVIHSGSQILYYQNYEVFNKYSGWKVIVNMSGKYYSHDKEYIYVSESDIPGRNVVGVYVESEEIGKKVKRLLVSKLYRFVVDNNKTSGFNSSFLNLPKITKELINFNTNEDLYTFFGLTNEEIEYVESNVA